MRQANVAKSVVWLAPYADGASVRLPGAMWLIMSAPA
jgi:hypothetical protein